MSASQRKENLLSSWKEIAAYLDCSERTCRRWEKIYGLPVYRIHEESKSRIYTYKEELDRWLEEGVANKIAAPKLFAWKFKWTKSPYFLIPILLIAVISVAYLFFLKEPGLKKLPTSPKKSAAAGIPQSTGPLSLRDNDIVTTEFPLRTRVWRKSKNNIYKEVWRIEPVRHSSIAVGNVDNKNDCEIVGPGVCRLTEKKGARQVSQYKYWINVYKQGKKDWWKTTYYSNSDCVFEEKSLELSEIAIADVDGESGNEIIIITKHYLAIFKYNTEEEEFRLLSSRYSFLDDSPMFLKSIVACNIDDDEVEEILVAADELDELGTGFNKGWILIFKVQDNWPHIYKSIQVDANLAYQSLRVGDVIEGGYPEIITSAYRLNHDIWNTLILGWDTEGEKLFEKRLYDRGDYEWRLAHLDVGNLTSNAGEEIIVGHHVPDELIYYYWDGTKLKEGSRFALSHQHFALSNVYIADTDDEPDSLGKVIACGAGFEGGGTGQFYLEVLGFNQGFFSKWLRLGGEREEIKVDYAALGRRYEIKK